MRLFIYLREGAARALKWLTALILLVVCLPYILFLTVEHLEVAPVVTEPARTLFWERALREMYNFFSKGF